MLLDGKGTGYVNMTIDGVSVGTSDPKPRLILTKVKTGQTVYVNGHGSGFRYCFFIPD